MVSKLKTLFSRPKGQAIAEFSLALPILMLVVVGLLEAGRAVFMYSSVVNASREAVRYATAYGVNESDVPHIQNCEEIRNTARRVGFLLSLADGDIDITYDGGLDEFGAVQSLADSPECASDETVDTSIELTCGDRVVVTVRADYDPILPLLIPLTSHTFESTSARTYMGIIELAADAETCD